jgi:hypothetical protein
MNLLATIFALSAVLLFGCGGPSLPQALSQCLGAGTIAAGTYPAGSFILGKSVSLEFDTSNGILTFLGTLSPDTSQIGGNYSVSDGICNTGGTAVLSTSSAGLGAWDY